MATVKPITIPPEQRREIESLLLDGLRRDPTGCWMWTGPVCGGYGRLRDSGRSYSVHRLSYQLYCGPLAVGRVVYT